MARRNERIWIIAALVTTALLIFVELFVTLNGDIEIHQSIANELHRYHQLPYLGSWDENFPGIDAIQCFSIAIFGNSAFGFRLFDLLTHIAMAGMMYFILRRWLTPTVTLMSIILYDLFYATNIAAIAGERETYAMFFLLAATLLLFRAYDRSISRSQNILLVLAGFCFGMMVCIRPTFGLYVVCAALFSISSQDRAIERTMLLLCGAALAVIGMLLPYLFVAGGIQEFYDSTIRYNVELYGTDRRPLSMLFARLSMYKFFLLPAVLALIILMFRRRWNALWHQAELTSLRKPESMLIVGYALSGILSLLVMGKYWHYHFEPIVLIAVPFSAIAFRIAWLSVPNILRYGGAALLLVYFYVAIVPLLPLHSIQTDMDFFPADDDAVAHYIDAHSAPYDRFEVASIHAGVRWRVDRRSATRFTTFNPIGIAKRDGSHPDFQEAWRQEYIDSLLSARPRFIALSHVAPLEFPAPVLAIHSVPGFDSKVLPHYRLDTIMAGYTILRRID